MRRAFIIVFTIICCLPAWCQSGKIVFSTNRSGNSEIYVMNADGSAPTNLTNTPSIDEDFPNWRADGNRIVYQRTDAAWTMNADGSGQAVLLQGGSPLYPDFHPSGSPIIFSRPFTSDFDICKVNADGSGFSQVLSNYLGDYYARWSPDGTKFSFYTFTNGGSYPPDVYVANADGSNQTRLTSGARNQNADWSPDGKKIVFDSDRNGNREIYIMNADGTSQTRLTTNAGLDTYPTFSPDGSKIAFTSNRDGNNEIYVMNVNGTGLTRLTNNTADDHGPQWIIPPPADAPTVNISDATVTEGNSGTTNLDFTISLTSASASTVTVSYNTLGDTAFSPADFTAANGASVVFAPGEITKSISIPIQGDSLDEDDESFRVLVTNTLNAIPGDDVGVGTILDDDAPPSVSIADLTTNEGQTSSTNVTLTVTLSSPSSKAVTVNYATADDSATAPGDYTATSGTVTIPAGSTSATFTVPVIGDTTREADESFFVNLSSPANATIDDGQAVVTIVNDDFPKISINSVTVTEGNSGQTDATFTISLSESSPDTITVDYATQSLGAQAGSDFVATNGTVTLLPGETTATVTVPVIGDVLDEFDETFWLTLSNPTKSSLANSTGTGTITDDDAAPTLSISDNSRYEGNSGTSNLLFTVSLSSVSGKTVSFRYTTTDGTATQPSDYTARNTTAFISAGSTSVTVSVPILGDTAKESDETFVVDLSNPANATIADGQAVGTILTDDLPLLSINNTSVTEGNTGQVNTVFTITLSEPSSDTVTVDFATSADTATADTDYVTTSGSRTFLPGDTTKTVVVPVNGDTIDEFNEKFNVTLSNPVNALIRTGLTSDPSSGHYYELVSAPLSWAAAKAAAEARTYGGVQGHLATITSASEQSYIANLISGSEAWIGAQQAPGSTEPADGFAWVTNESFSYTNWRSGEPNNASGNEDAILFTYNGTWNDTSSQSIVANYLVEYETLKPPNIGVATIIDDDAAPTVSVSDAQVTEGDNGTANADFTLTLSTATEKPVGVDVNTLNGTATAGTDYQSINSTVVIPAGQTTFTVSIPVTGDVIDEDDEMFSLNLTGASNATIVDDQGIGTIVDDDITPAASITDVTITEGNSGTKNAVFTVTLNAAGKQTATVNYATSDGNAKAGSDYVAQSSNVTFLAGQTNKTISVAINGDVLNESDEKFYVNLSTPANVSLARTFGVGTIVNDDALPLISVGDVSIVEGRSGTKNLTFTATQSVVSGRTTSFDFATSDGTAKAATDYAAKTGTVSFAAGQTSKTISIVINGDVQYEPDERFFLNFSNTQNARLMRNYATGTILNDDVLSEISINDVSVTEGRSGTKSLTFTVTLNSASGSNVSVNYSTVNGTATAGSDYVAKSGTLSFSAGQTSKTISIPINGDLAYESDESFTLNLSNPVNAVIARANGVGTILNDDTSG